MRSTQSALETIKLNFNANQDELSNIKISLHNTTEQKEDNDRENARKFSTLKRAALEEEGKSNQLLLGKNNEIENLLKDIRVLEKHVEEEKMAKERFKKKNTDLNATIDDLTERKNEEIERLQKEFASSKADIAVSNENLTSLKLSTLKQASRFENELETFQTDLVEEKRKVSHLNSENGKLTLELETVARKNVSLNSEKNAAIIDKEANCELIDELRREVRGLGRKCELSEDKNHESIRRAELSEEKCKTLEIANENATHELDNLEKLSTLSQKEIITTKKDIHSLKEELNSLEKHQSILKGKLEENQSLNSQLSLSEATLQEKLTKVESANYSLGEKLEQNSSIVSKSKKLEQELSNIMTDITKSREEALAATSNFNDLQLKSKRLEDTTANLNANLFASKEEVAVMRETLQNVKAANAAKDDAVAAANKKAEITLHGKKNAEEELEEVRKNLYEMARNKRAAETECSKLRRTNDSLQIDVEEVGNKLRRCESELEEIRSASSVGDEVAILRKQMHSMRSKMLGEDGENDDEDCAFFEDAENEGNDDLNNSNEEHSQVNRSVSSRRRVRINESKLLEAKREKEAYETIIGKLRDELASEADKRRQLLADLSSARKEAAIAANHENTIAASKSSIRRLEEDLANKDVEIARSRRQELTAVALSAECERNVGRAKDAGDSISNDMSELQVTASEAR